jgi:hypothetical protein
LDLLQKRCACPDNLGTLRRLRRPNSAHWYTERVMPPPIIDWAAVKAQEEAERAEIADALAAGPEACRRVQVAFARIRIMDGAAVPVVDIDEGWDGL